MIRTVVKPSSRLVAAAFAAIAFATLGSASASADEKPPPAPPAGAAPAEREKGPGVVKLDITETLDGDASRDAYATYLIRKKLREAGFVCYTEKPLRVDEYEKKQREKAAAGKKPAPGATGATPAAPTGTAVRDEEPRPTPDLVIKGTIDVGLSHTSKFYGQDVAFMYVGAGDLRIDDGTGKHLCDVDERDEWGKTTEKAAREDEYKRIAAFLSAAILKAEPIQARLSEKAKVVVNEYVNKIESKRTKKGGGGEEGGASEGEEGKK